MVVLNMFETDIEIRLSGGLNASNGRVEIAFQGIWGTICDDAITDNDVTVICRMLGYK